MDDHACRLRVFVYPSVLPSLAHQIETAHFFLPPPAPPAQPHKPHKLHKPHNMTADANCLQDACTYDDFLSFGTRQYTADWPLYNHMVSQCPQTPDPAEADVFLVPFLFGYMMTSAWDQTWVPDKARRRREHNRMVDNALAIPKQLPYLNATTAHRHIFLFSNDGQFVNLDLHRHLKSSIVVHLGDDLWAGSQHDPQFRHSHYLSQSMSVPYRVSQWLPLGMPSVPSAHARPTLLSMNVNMKRSSARGAVSTMVLAAADALNARSAVQVTTTMLHPHEAVSLANASTFCLCPTGDSKGL